MKVYYVSYKAQGEDHIISRLFASKLDALNYINREIEDKHRSEAAIHSSDLCLEGSYDYYKNKINQ